MAERVAFALVYAAAIAVVVWRVFIDGGI